ncbi:hypothetical protein [Streptomyces bottropensis]|uniref:hypothetical protein n=1 Tax=Streptomyces bottropensis TaxID=42235 RepID=UPI0036A6D971
MTTSTDLMVWVSEQLLTHKDWRRDLPLLAAPARLWRSGGRAEVCPAPRAAILWG